MSSSTSTKWSWLASPKLREIIARVVALTRAIRRTSSLLLLPVMCILLVPQITSAAIASIGSLATANSKTSGSSWTFTTSAQLDQNNAGVLVIGVDNQDTSDLNSTLCASVSDAAGNDWVKAREFTNGQGGADSGATVCIFYTKAKANLASGGNVTVTLSTAKTAKAAAMWEFSMNAAMILTVAAGSDLANDAADAGSMSISGLASQEYLFVRGGSVESSGTTYTASTNYTAFTHSSSTTAGSSSASNIGARGEFRILTATSSSTDPTTSASDQASTYVALSEITPPAGGGPRRIFISRNNQPTPRHQ
jgi:hypothetical protein